MVKIELLLSSSKYYRSLILPASREWERGNFDTCSNLPPVPFSWTRLSGSKSGGLVRPYWWVRERRWETVSGYECEVKAKWAWGWRRECSTRVRWEWRSRLWVWTWGRRWKWGRRWRRTWGCESGCRSTVSKTKIRRSPLPTTCHDFFFFFRIRSLKVSG